MIKENNENTKIDFDYLSKNNLFDNYFYIIEKNEYFFDKNILTSIDYNNEMPYGLLPILRDKIDINVSKDVYASFEEAIYAVDLKNSNYLTNSLREAKEDLRSIFLSRFTFRVIIASIISSSMNEYLYHKRTENQKKIANINKLRTDENVNIDNIYFAIKKVSASKKILPEKHILPITKVYEISSVHLNRFKEYIIQEIESKWGEKKIIGTVEEPYLINFKGDKNIISKISDLKYGFINKVFRIDIYTSIENNDDIPAISISETDYNQIIENIDIMKNEKLWKDDYTYANVIVYEALEETLRIFNDYLENTFS